MKNYAPFRQPALVFLAIGAVLGLILGLLIGWVFWPVEWTGVTLRDLNTAEKAEYIAAVADAFVIYDSPEAAAVAQRRLAPLDDGNLDQTFQEALRYFGESQFSDRAIRDSNIRRLAVALNMSQPSAVVAAQDQAGNVAEATATSAPEVMATPLPTAADNSRLGWVGWLLWFLTAILLLVGGLYILNKAGLPDLNTLLKPRSRATNTVDEFDEPQTDPAQGRRGAGTTVISTAPNSVDPFDQEEDDEWQPPRRPVGRPVAQPSPADQYRRPQAHVYDADEIDEEDFTDTDFADYDAVDSDLPEDVDSDRHSHEPFDDDDDDGGRWRSTQSSYTIDVADERNPPPAPNAGRSPAPSSGPVDGRRPERGAEVERNTPGGGPDQPSAALMATAASPSRSTVQRANKSESSAPAARTRAKVIDHHIFHYQAGMAEYDESRPIVDPQSGKYIGEFGMGASSKNGLAQLGPDQLAALEVWLFDKSDERNLGNQTRILLSEYAVDHNLDQLFLKERQDNPRPFTAQPGIHFQLESQNLLLDCTIVDVHYSPNSATKGIFQQITVDMTVQQKNSSK